MANKKTSKKKQKTIKKPTKKQIEERKLLEQERKEKEQLFKERAEFHAKVLQAKQVWKIGKRKAAEISADFKNKRDDYSSTKEYKEASKKLHVQQKQVLESVKQKYIKINKEYKEKYELGSYKFKRWFFGMGKEFERITWCNNKTLWISFIIIIIVVTILTILFFLVDLISTVPKVK